MGSLVSVFSEFIASPWGDIEVAQLRVLLETVWTDPKEVNPHWIDFMMGKAFQPFLQFEKKKAWRKMIQETEESKQEAKQKYDECMKPFDFKMSTTDVPCRFLSQTLGCRRLVAHGTKLDDSMGFGFIVTDNETDTSETNG